MSWLRSVIANLGFRPNVAKPPELPRESQELHKEAKALRHDLRELRRFEIIVRKR